MRRIFQFSAFILILTVLLAPVSEAFDRWDPPGLGHDTEFAVVGFVFCIVLVLLVSKLVAMLSQVILLVPMRDALAHYKEILSSTAVFHIDHLSVGLSPPLRT